MLQMLTTLSETWNEKSGETEKSRGEQKREENILTFSLQTWEDFLDLENLLQMEDTAYAQLVSLCIIITA